MRRHGIILAFSFLLAAAALTGSAYAFHERGVANCDGCHIMHDSEDGASPFGSTGGNAGLLRYASPTDVCLACHARDNGEVLGSSPLNPPPELGAGNFVYLLEDNINDEGGGAFNPIAGNHAGHNVSSTEWGIPVDPDHNVGPGNLFPSSELSCISCHDHHGNDNFRMLRGAGPVGTSGYTFAYGAPDGEGIDLSMGGRESPTNHTAYNSGWSAWCANCHGFFHRQDYQVFEHPTDESLDSEERDTYNLYNGPTDPTGGTYATAYLPELPLQELIMSVSGTTGATLSSRISCMTCHRAHATSAPGSLRWDAGVVFLSQDGVESGSYALPDPFSDPSQRALCVKCHYDEVMDHGLGGSCMSCHRYNPGFSDPPADN